MSLRTVDEPPMRRSGKAKVDWPAVADRARRTGKWVEVKGLSRTTANSIKAGRYRHIKPEEFEVTTRIKDGEATLYVRVWPDE